MPAPDPMQPPKYLTLLQWWQWDGWWRFAPKRDKGDLSRQRMAAENWQARDWPLEKWFCYFGHSRFSRPHQRFKGRR